MKGEKVSWYKFEYGDITKCELCPFMTEGFECLSEMCNLVGVAIDSIDSKPKWCPLIEMKEVKDV
jgi:hypothetical protein